MIATTLIGLTSAFTKNKKAKIALLLLEIAIISIAYKKSSKEHDSKILQEKENLQ